MAEEDNEKDQLIYPYSLPNLQVKEQENSLILGEIRIAIFDIINCATASNGRSFSLGNGEVIEY